MVRFDMSSLPPLPAGWSHYAPGRAISTAGEIRPLSDLGLPMPERAVRYGHGVHARVREPAQEQRARSQQARQQRQQPQQQQLMGARPNFPNLAGPPMVLQGPPAFAVPAPQAAQPNFHALPADMAFAVAAGNMPMEAFPAPQWGLQNAGEMPFNPIAMPQWGSENTGEMPVQAPSATAMATPSPDGLSGFDPLAPLMEQQDWGMGPVGAPLEPLFDEAQLRAGGLVTPPEDQLAWTVGWAMGEIEGDEEWGARAAEGMDEAEFEELIREAYGEDPQA